MKDKELEKLKEEIKAELKEEIMLELFKKLLCGKNSNLDEKVDNKELEKLQNENNILKEKIDNLKIQKNNLENEINDKNRNIQLLDTQLNEIKNSNNSLLLQFQELERNQIRELKEFKNLYSKLSKTTQIGLQNVLKNSDNLSLFCSGIKNIGNVWDYALHLETEHKDEEFKIMREMFYLLFEIYKNIENVQLDDVNEGDKFKSELYEKSNRSEEYNGNIKKVILRGYKKGNKIIKASLVKL